MPRIKKPAKMIVAEAVKEWARSNTGLKGELGKEGYEVLHLDTVDNLKVHVEVGDGHKTRLFSITVKEHNV